MSPAMRRLPCALFSCFLAFGSVSALVSPSGASAAAPAQKMNVTTGWVRAVAAKPSTRDRVQFVATAPTSTAVALDTSISFVVVTHGGAVDCSTVRFGINTTKGLVALAPTHFKCSPTRMELATKVTHVSRGKQLQLRFLSRPVGTAPILAGTAVVSAKTLRQTESFRVPFKISELAPRSVEPIRAQPAPATAKAVPSASIKAVPSVSPTVAPVATTSESATATPGATAYAAPVASTSPTTAQAGADTSNSEMGLAVPSTDLLWKTPAERAQILDRVVATGAKYIRVDVAMSQLSWDGPDQIDFATLDRTVTDVTAHGLTMVGILQTLPAYAHEPGAPDTYGPTTQAQRDLFSSFSARMAEHYRGKISTWEVWNEENTKTFWYPRPDASAYASLLRETYTAIKAKAPEDVVVAGGTGGASQAVDIPPLEFIAQIYAQGAGPYFDALAVHAYTNPQAGNIGEFLELPRYRSLMDANGDATKQLWITEAGTKVGSGWATDNQAVDFVPQLVSAWKSVHNHGPMFMFTLNDYADPGFGLLRPDGSSRPVLAAWTAAVRQVAQEG